MISHAMRAAVPDQLPLLSLPPRREMERAYERSDASYDGVFYLGVRTTGIFCRPSCHARKPKPENVEFFAAPKEARFAGYRPCRKCKPLNADEAPAWVTRLLDRIDPPRFEPAADETRGLVQGLGARGVVRDQALGERYQVVQGN